jgi:site-specific recombinase XerD
MTVRIVKRRGERRLVIDIVYRNSDGTQGRFRRDAEVQTLPAARAEDRRRLTELAATGSLTPAMKVETASNASKQALSFSAVAKEYLATYAMSQLKPSTRRGYASVIERFLKPRLGELPIDAIDANRMRELDAELVRRGVEPATRRQMQAVLRSILCRFAVESGRLTEAPRFPRLPKAGLKVRESICHGEVAAPKSGHERVVPLVPELRTALQKVRPRERDKFVALNAHGRAWTDGGLLQAFQRAYQRAGLKGWRFHDLRHFFVTALFRKGVAAPTVQALAGHAHLTTTERYAHVARTDLKAAIARLAG